MVRTSVVPVSAHVLVALVCLPRGCEATWPRKAEEGEAGVGAGATLNALACACSCSALPKGSAQASEGGCSGAAGGAARPLKQFGR